MAEIEVKSMEDFLTENENAIIMLNECAIPIANVLANVQSIVTSNIVEEINNNLAKLESINFTESNPGDLNFNIRIDSPDNLNSDCDKLITWFKDHSIDVIFSIRSIEQMIKDFNGKKLPSNKFEEYLNQLRGTLSDTSEMGLYWMIYYALNTTININGAIESVTPVGHGLSYLMVYGTDTEFAGGDFWVGDTITLPFFLGQTPETIMTMYGEIELVSWSNITTGACAVLIFNVAKDMLGDKGNYTDRDFLRTALSAGQGGANYLVWAAVSSEVAFLLKGAGIGASIAGPVGAVAGTAVVLVMLPFEKYVINKITKDEIGHTYFDSNNNERQIPRNGTGREKSYDVILGHAIGGNETIFQKVFNQKEKPVSLTDKISLYYELSQNGYYVDEDEDNNYSYDAKNFNSFLTEISRASSYSEVLEIERKYDYWEVGGTLVPRSSITNDAATECSPSGLFYSLSKGKFNVREYYEFINGNYRYIAERNNPITAYKLTGGSSTAEDVFTEQDINLDADIQTNTIENGTPSQNANNNSTKQGYKIEPIKFPNGAVAEGVVYSDGSRLVKETYRGSTSAYLITPDGKKFPISLDNYNMHASNCVGTISTPTESEMAVNAYIELLKKEYGDNWQYFMSH